MALGGCVVEGPALERVPVAAPVTGERGTTRELDGPKPLPERSRLFDREPPPDRRIDEMPLANETTPEQRSFETAYRGVGRPRITVFVNRTLDGEVLPATNAAPEGSHAGERGYLRHGEYDEASAAALDYEGVENILTDALACQGAVEIISPTAVRQKLTDEQVKDLQSGKPRVLRDIAGQLDADVLVHVAVHPTRQTTSGLEVRLVGEALNVKGGQQIGRVVVDMPPPLERTALNRYARFVARKLMTDMTHAWTTGDMGRGGERSGGPAPVPAPTPTPTPTPAPGVDNK
jgi:hypothetical protein